MVKIVTSSHGGTQQKISTSNSGVAKVVVVCMANSGNISSGPVITQVGVYQNSIQIFS